MFRFLGIVFLFLLAGLTITLATGSMVSLAFIMGIYYFVIFFGIYVVLYFLVALFSKKEISPLVNIILIVLSIISIFGYHIAMYVQETITYQNERTEKEDTFKKALENLPANIEISDYLSISTEGLKDENGNPITFKWGDLTLTSIQVNRNESIEVNSVNQPKELPTGIKCDSKILFSPKDREVLGNSENYYAAEHYFFEKCKVKAWQTEFNNQKITLKDFNLYASESFEKSYLYLYPREVKESIKKIVLNQSKSNHFWYFKLDGYIKLDNDWNADELTLFVDKETKPIALIADIHSPQNLNNMYFQDCLIRPNRSRTLLMLLDNQKLALDLSDINGNCSKTVESSFHYINSKTDNSIHFDNKFTDIEEKVKLWLSPYFRLSPEIRVDWSENYAQADIRELDSEKDIPFYWGDLKLRYFRLNASGAQVRTSEDYVIKLGDLTCDHDEFFSHNVMPKDNSLAQENFTLTRCNIKNEIIKFNGKPIKIWEGELSYHFPIENIKSSKSFFESRGSINSLTSDYLKLTLTEPQHFIRLNGYAIYARELILDKAGNVLALQGETRPSSDEKATITFGECKYEARYSWDLILSHFSEQEVDVTLPPFVGYSKRNCLADRVEKHPYELTQ